MCMQCRVTSCMLYAMPCMLYAMLYEVLVVRSLVMLLCEVSAVRSLVMRSQFVPYTFYPYTYTLYPFMCNRILHTAWNEEDAFAVKPVVYVILLILPSYIQSCRSICNVMCHVVDLAVVYVVYVMLPILS